MVSAEQTLQGQFVLAGTVVGTVVRTAADIVAGTAVDIESQ